MDFPTEYDTFLLAGRRLSHKNSTPGRRGRWSRPELVELLKREAGDDTEMPRVSRQGGPFEDAISAGDFRCWDTGGRGTAYQAVVPMNLMEILEWAEGRIDPEKSASRGANSGSDPEARRHHHLTKSQYEMARAACKKLGEEVNPEDPEAGLADIGREILVWDDDAGKGDLGDWGSALKRLRLACANQDITEGTTNRYVGSLRTLLDLAATREWIPRTELHNPAWEPLPAVWAELFSEWHELLLNEDGFRTRGASIKGSLLALFRGASEEGATDPRQAPWTEIIPQLEAKFEALDWPSYKCTNIRRAYRALRAAGALKGPEWDPVAARIDRSPGLVRVSDCREVGKLYGRKGHRTAVRAALEGKECEWPERFDQFPGLVDGQYGLRRVLIFASTWGEEQQKLGFPEGKKKPLSSATIRIKLYQLVRAAGVVSAHFGVDWSEEDLGTLYRPEHLKQYYDYLQQESDATSRTRAKYLIALGTVVGFYLIPLAEHDRDTEIAERFEYAYHLIYADGVEGRSSWVDRLDEQDDANGNTTLEDMKATSLRVERVWTRKQTVADFAYDQMMVVGKQALKLLAEEYGPIEEQIAALENGRTTTEIGRNGALDVAWAVTVRDTLLFWDQLVVPYRTKTLVEMDMHDRLHSQAYSWIGAKVHSSKRKAPNREWHEPNYRLKETSPYPALLYRLYEMAGGARDKLLTRPDGSRWGPDPSYDDHRRKPGDGDGLREPFYVNPITQSKYARRGKYSVRGDIKRVARRVLERWPGVLGGITYEELATAPEDKNSVLVPHTFRHALAKWALCDPDASEGERKTKRLDVVCNVLDHASADMIWRVYAGTSEAEYCIGSMTAPTSKSGFKGPSTDSALKPARVLEHQLDKLTAGLSVEARMKLARRLLSHVGQPATPSAGEA